MEPYWHLLPQAHTGQWGVKINIILLCCLEHLGEASRELRPGSGFYSPSLEEGVLHCHLVSYILSFGDISCHESIGYFCPSRAVLIQSEFIIGEVSSHRNLVIFQEMMASTSVIIPWTRVRYCVSPPTTIPIIRRFPSCVGWLLPYCCNFSLIFSRVGVQTAI